MESHQENMLSNSSLVAQPLESKPTSMAPNFGHSLSNGQRKEDTVVNSKGFVGVLDVFIHQARDIHNICIYHKQDVYAKIYLTSHPEIAVSTHTINGGGQNPVFNENLRLSVQTVDSTLKCEIWMLSRVRNYLQDQLLGFALVPLSGILLENGKLAQEFELSSSDLFHSPSGLVKLSIAYTGSTPEVLEIPAPPSSVVPNAAYEDSEVCDAVSCELEKIEFPDPKIANENEMMVTEYYSIPCPAIECESSASCDPVGKEDRGIERFAEESHDAVVVPKMGLPLSCDSLEESPSALAPTISEPILDSSRDSNPIDEDAVQSLEDKKEKAGEVESSISTSLQPIISINVEPEQKVVQQDFVDMYMNSMKQFTEALAKMKLPLDMENRSPDSGRMDSNGKIQPSKGEGPSPKVFYGSRAFF